jgi:hypothetical protein
MNHYEIAYEVYIPETDSWLADSEGIRAESPDNAVDLWKQYNSNDGYIFRKVRCIGLYWYNINPSLN